MKIEKGQVAVVTGAASGIGLSICSEMARRGVHVVMADIDADRLATAAAQNTLFEKAVVRTCDVSDADAVIGLRDFALDAFGQVDFVFNNAGVVLPFSPMWDYQPSDWKWLLGINLWGVVNGIQAFVPYLVKRGTGHVINTASMAGVGIIATNGVYNAAKHAVVSLTETLGEELAVAAPGVHASVLCPGLVPTRIAESAQLRPNATASPVPSTLPRPQSTSENVTISSAEVALRTLRGIEENRMYIFPNPGSEAFIRDRFERIERDLRAGLLFSALDPENAE